MTILHHILGLSTDPGVGIYNITPQIQTQVRASGVENGQVLVFSRHTTTALAINEDESRLLQDVKAHLERLAPAAAPYLHNDLHLRENIPADEPMNAHSHLMAMMLSSSEVIPIIKGQLALGTYQSVLFFDLDGPRQRTVLIQIFGE